MRFAKIAIIVILGFGWLVPLLLSAYLYANWIYLVAHAGSAEAAAAHNSFPFVAESKRMAAIACIWAAIVAASWALWWLRSRDRKSVQNGQRFSVENGHR